MKTISIIGSGQMGAGIAQVAAFSGFKTFVYDTQAESLVRGQKVIESSLAKFVEKEKIKDADKQRTLANLSFVDDLNALKDSDLVIEAIVENFAVKAELFKKLDALCSPSCILASNTSSISITKLAASTKRPEQVIGMHFMNPVPLMQLVEIIRGLQTSEETYKSILGLSEKLSKVAVTARHDYPGFIVNRILIPMLNEAVFVLMEGIATPEEIDTAMKLGTNQPMGPLALADLVGLDTCLAIAKIFHEEFGDDKYRPCPLLVKYVEAGWLGRKVGRGFYRY